MVKKILLAVVFTAASTLTSAAEFASTDFSFTDTRGETQSLSRYKGRWVLLNLWATWCIPCLAEMPELEALHTSRKDVAVIGLAVDGQATARVIQFAEKLHVTYPIVAGSADSVKKFHVRGYPTSIVFDAFGTQVFVKEGVTTRSEIERMIDGSGR